MHLKGPKGTVTFYRSAAATFLGKDAPKTESNAIGQCRPNVEESIQVKENLLRLKKLIYVQSLWPQAAQVLSGSIRLFGQTFFFHGSGANFT